MNNLLKLGLAVVVGLVAAVLNHMSLANQMVPKEYVRAARQVQAGSIIGESDMERLMLPSVSEGLNKSLVPWSERATLKGARAARVINQGDPIFWADSSPKPESLLEPGEAAVHVPLQGIRYPATLLGINRQVRFLVRNESTKTREKKAFDLNKGLVAEDYSAAEVEVKYRTIGPYRIIGLGGGLLQRSTSSDSSSLDKGSRASIDSMTIAVKVDPKSGQVEDSALEFIAAARGSGGKYGFIDAVMVVPDKKAAE